MSESDDLPVTFILSEPSEFEWSDGFLEKLPVLDVHVSHTHTLYSTVHVVCLNWRL